MFDTDHAPAPGLLPGVPWSEFEPSGLLTDLLSSLDVDNLDADDALETAAAWERLVAHAQAQQFGHWPDSTTFDQAPTSTNSPPLSSPRYCTYLAAPRAPGWTWPPGCRPGWPTPWRSCSPE